jgi:hypothetical protein
MEAGVSLAEIIKSVSSVTAAIQDVIDGKVKDDKTALDTAKSNGDKLNQGIADFRTQMTNLGESVADYTQLRTIFDDIETRGAALRTALLSSSPTAAAKADALQGLFNQRRGALVPAGLTGESKGRVAAVRDAFGNQLTQVVTFVDAGALLKAADVLRPALRGFDDIRTVVDDFYASLIHDLQAGCD